jgi:hypothetical protein
VSIERASSIGQKGTINTMVMLICVLLFPPAAYPQAREFALEVATMRSQQSAVEIANGLVARGYEASWVKADRGRSGVFYRVRLGKFPELDFARNYAESLLDSGLLDTCAITVSGPPGQIEEAKSESKSEDFLTVLRKTRWVLSSNQSIIYSLLPHSGSSFVNSENDIVVVMRAIDKKRWRLRADIEFLTLAASGKPATINPTSISSSALDTVAAEFNQRVSRTFSEGLTSLIPKSNQKTTVTALATNTKPKLQGSVEMRNGQLVVRLRNLDSQRGFRGTARVSLSDGKSENETAPLAIELQPSEEKTIQISEPSMPYGGSVLMVYDVKKAVQLIRSAPFGIRPKTNVAANQQSADQELDEAIPETAAEMTAKALEAVDESLGEDDNSNQSDPANPANPSNGGRQNVRLNLTTTFEGEIEGGTHIPPKNPKVNK